MTTNYGPEQRMIGVSAAIVLNGDSNAFRHRAEVTNQIFNAFRSQGFVAFKSGIEVGDVGGMMAVVVDFHRACVDCRLKRIECVSEVGNSVSHVGDPILGTMTLWTASKFKAQS